MPNKRSDKVSRLSDHWFVKKLVLAKMAGPLAHCAVLSTNWDEILYGGSVLRKNSSKKNRLD